MDIYNRFSKFSSDVKWLIPIVFLIKVTYCILIFYFFDFNIAEEFYDEIAMNLISGHGYVIQQGHDPNLFRPPIYPFFLAILFKSFGLSYYSVVAVQIVFDITTSLIIFSIAKSVFDQKIAFFSSIGFALYPFSSYYTARILTESMFTLLLSFIILYLLKAFQTKSNKDFFLVGLLLGIGILCRFSLQFFPLVILTGLTILYGYKHRYWLKCLLLIAGVCLAISPWTLRNYQITGSWLILGTGGGYNLWLGNHIPTDGRDNDELEGEKLQLLKDSISEITQGKGDQFSAENNRRFFKEALKGIRDNPSGTMVLMIKKAFRFWFSIFHPDHRWFSWFLIPIQGLILTLASLGIYFSIKERKEIFHPLSIILYFNLIHAAVAATFRYSIPIMPYVIMFAVYGVHRLSKVSPLKFKLKGEQFGKTSMMI